jgi:uncharacterized protein (TIGR03086 family)
MTTSHDSRITANGSDDVPYFLAAAPAVFRDEQATSALLAPVLAALADVVDVPDDDLDRVTPCEKFTTRQLRDHVLGWLQFFAAALNDPDRATSRPDPDTYRAEADPRDLATVVRDSAARIETALGAGVLDRQVVMSQARMDGPAVAAMMLGEYVVHGWDLARSQGRDWTPSEPACEAAREFLSGMIAPEHRGAEAGFFGAEVAVPAGASALDRLLGFAGRDPAWWHGA